uniref:Uncharacterized protein n=1 Tax=Ursus maritimus TaxID=29073 RepID=A0A452UPD0_URSMA
MHLIWVPFHNIRLLQQSIISKAYQVFMKFWGMFYLLLSISLSPSSLICSSVASNLLLISSSVFLISFTEFFISNSFFFIFSISLLSLANILHC